MKTKLLSLLVALFATISLWASNVITYTATEKLPETTDTWSEGLHTNAFNVSISSHEFSNGAGTIIFAGEVTTIGDWAFYSCKSLTSITIPNSVTTIGGSAFLGCSGLTSITFAENSQLTYIRDWAFRGCSALTSITIPDYVTTIGSWTFAECSSLASITIGKSVTTYGEEPFYLLDSLTSVIWNAINFEYTGGQPFHWSPITSFVFGDEVKIIPSYLCYDLTKLTSITIPYSVTEIGYGAFFGCSGLTSITCEAITPPTCGSSCFSGVDKSIPVYVPAQSINAYKQAEGWKEFTNIQGSKCIVASGTCGIEETSHIWELTCDSVLTISGNCEISYNIEDAPWKKYEDMISTLIVNEGVVDISPYFVTRAPNLKTIYWNTNEITYWSDGHRWCSLEEIVFGDGVTHVPQFMCYGANTLKKVTLSETITSIGNQAFYGCSIMVPTYNTHVFAYLPRSYQGSYSIPVGIESIASDAFEFCSALTSITISNSITTIGDYAFYGCHSLTSITCEAITPPTCDSWCFYNVNKSIPVYVPAQSISAYKTAEGWEEFTKLQANPNDYANVACNAENGSVYGAGKYIKGDTCTLTSTPNYGYHFTQWSDGNTENPRSFVVMQDTTFTAEFAKNVYTISTHAEHGSVMGGGDYEYLTSIQLTATADEHYHFDRWSDGNTNNPRQITVTGDATYSAIFSINQHTISATTEHGIVNGIGVYDYGTEAVLIVVPDYGYKFSSWNDGNTKNPRTILVTENANYSGTCVPLVSGACGDNLYWSYKTGKLTIMGFGEMYNYSYNEVPWILYRDSIQQVELCEGLISIGNYAFYNCSSLTSITCEATTPPNCRDNCFENVDISILVYVPAQSISLYKVATGWKDFTNIQGIGDIKPQNNIITYEATTKLPETTSTYSSGLHTNAFNVAITSHDFSNGTGAITLAGEVTTIGDYAFNSCTGLTSITIPNSVTVIGEGVFANCSGLTSVTIPNSVTTIGRQAFAHCSGLTSVTIGNSVTTIGDWAFEACNGLTSVTIPNSVATIGEGVFANCSGLTSVTIGNSVTTIGEWAFSWSKGLTSINVDAANTHYSSLDGVLFNYAKDTLIRYPIGNTRTEYIIPNSVTTIRKNAFDWCDGLTSVTIGYSVTTIGDWAFDNCSGLTSVTCEAITPPACGSSCFSGVDKSIPVYVPAQSISLYKVAMGWKDFTNIQGIGDIKPQNNIITYEATEKLPETTDYSWNGSGLHTNAFNVAITSHEFSNGIGTIIFADDVTTIGYYAFACCSGLTSVIIPNSVTTIGGSAFFNCSGLTSVTIPYSITTIENSAFSGCSGLTSVTFTEGSKLQMIEGNAFSSCSGLTSVTILASVISIGHSAFSGCSSLTSVTIGNSVTTIEWGAFAWCSSLTSVTIGNSVTTIGEDAFFNCSGLTSITIPNSVTTIERGAFAACSGLTSINVDAANTHYCAIDGVLLNNAKDTLVQYPIGNIRTEYTIPYSVTTIDSYAFYYCSTLTSVTIPNSVTVIGESAFEDCSYLKTITLSKALTDIGCNAFKGDFRVEEITSYAEVTPNVCASTFDGLSKQYIYLYVPENSIRGYQVDPNWNDFDIRAKAADKKPIDGDNPIVTPTDQDVTITWPITEGTDTYTLTITKGGETVCVLTFNANGQLVNIAFKAPATNGSSQAPAATLTAQGYQFTVTGLNPGTAYNYSVTATDAGGKTLAEHKGNFSTTGGGTPTSMDKVHGSRCTMHKVLRNGQLLIETNNATYTLTGQKVR